MSVAAPVVPTTRSSPGVAWNGTRFAKSRVVVAAPKGFTSFNGIAVGPDGMLYTGVSLGDKPALDYTKGTSPYANDVIRVDPASGAISVQATGLRQPWQLTFAPGSKAPFVSELGQENLGKKRPSDYVLVATEGSNFGFPDCPAKPASCSKYAKHFAQFPAHSSPMGLGVLDSTLYVALFGGTGKGPEVVSMPVKGGKFETAPNRFCSTRRRARRPRREGLRRRPDRHHLQRESVTHTKEGGAFALPSFRPLIC